MITKVTDKEVKLTRGVEDSHIACDLAPVNANDEVNILAYNDGHIVMTATGHINQKGATGDASYGNFVKIAHRDGSYTLYAHLNEVFVKNNTDIKENSVIGSMGDSGNSYGKHLHFEIRMNHSYESRIDPVPYLNKTYIYKSSNIITEIQNGYNLLFNANGLLPTIDVDGSFGPVTKKALISALQYEMNTQYGCVLAIDGSFGPNTKSCFITLKRGMSGNITWLCQAMLYIRGHMPNGLDKIFGYGMEEAVREFQKMNGLLISGEIDKETAQKLFSL